MKNHLGGLIIMTILYVVMCHIPVLDLITFPVEMLCTYLHEFGHAIFAILSGGKVHAMSVNPDGSGATTTSGGYSGFISLGGYVGSAIFGNILLRLGTPNSAKIGLYTLGILMLTSTFLWFDNFITTTILMLFAISLFYFAGTNVSSLVISFFGAASIVYIIQDFNVGPTSDLLDYEREVGIFSAKVWMYVWLGIVIVITGANLYNLFKTNKK